MKKELRIMNYENSARLRLAEFKTIIRKNYENKSDNYNFVYRVHNMRGGLWIFF